MSYVGYQVTVVMQNGDVLQGVISYVDNQILKLRNVQTSDVSRGLVKELIVSASNIKDITLSGKEEESVPPPSQAPKKVPPASSPSSQAVAAASGSRADALLTPELIKGSVKESSASSFTPSSVSPVVSTPLYSQMLSTPPAPSVSPTSAYRDPAILSMSGSFPTPPPPPLPVSLLSPQAPHPSLTTAASSSSIAPSVLSSSSLAPSVLSSSSLAPSTLSSNQETQQLRVLSHVSPTPSASFDISALLNAVMTAAAPAPASLSRSQVQAQSAPQFPAALSVNKQPASQPQTEPQQQHRRTSSQDSNGKQKKKKEKSRPQEPSRPSTSSSSLSVPSQNTLPSFGRQSSVSPRRQSARDKQTFGASASSVRAEYREDFDFDASNAKFDKEKVFREMQAEYLEEHAANNVSSPVMSPTTSSRAHFTTDTGIVVPAVSAKHLREVWAWYEEAGGPLARSQFLENAGRSLAQLALKFLSAAAPAAKAQAPLTLEEYKVVVLTGPGCKGAAGICAARHLANHGVKVFVCRLRAYNLSPEVNEQWSMYQLTQGKEAHVGSLSVEPVDLIIDALIGCGLKGAPSPHCATLVRWANSNGAPVVCLEVPTGVDSTTGAVLGESVHPTATLTLGLPKPGLRKSTEFLYLADVGVPSTLYARLCTQLGVSPYVTPFQEGFISRLHTRT